jgi:putative endonuclease
LRGFSTRLPRRTHNGDTMPLAMREHSYTVYIMASHTGVLYVGMTNDLQHRVSQHKSDEIEGFTRKYHCQVPLPSLVYDERFQFVRAAIAREKRSKGWKRTKKIAVD